LITLKIFGATFRIGGGIAPIAPPGYAPVLKDRTMKVKILVIANAARLPLEMKTNPCCFNIKIQRDTK